mgnify:CR=1 FL=1
MCFPESPSTRVYAALCEFCGIVLNHTELVQSTVQLERVQLEGVHSACPEYRKFQLLQAVSNSAIVLDIHTIDVAVVA